MEKLQIHQLIRRIPYDVQFKWDDSPEETWGIMFEEATDYEAHLYPLDALAFTIDRQNEEDLEWKLLLRPITDLIIDITHKGEKFKPLDYLKFVSNSHDQEWSPIRTLFQRIIYDKRTDLINELPAWVYEYLLKWHFVIDEPESTYIPIIEESQGKSISEIVEEQES